MRISSIILLLISQQQIHATPSPPTPVTDVPIWTATPTHPPPTEHPMDCIKITGNTLTYPSADYNSTGNNFCWSFTPAYPGTVSFTLVRSPSMMDDLFVMNADHSSFSSLYLKVGKRVRVSNSNGGEMYISFSASGLEESSFEIMWMVGATFSPPTLAPTPSPPTWSPPTPAPPTWSPPTPAPPTPTPPIWTATPTYPPPTKHPMDCIKITGNTLTYPSADYDSTGHSCWSFTPAYPGTVWFTVLGSPHGPAYMYVMNADHSSYEYLFLMGGERTTVSNSNGGEMYISSPSGLKGSSFKIMWMVGETFAPSTRAPPTARPAPPTPTPPIWTAMPTHPPPTEHPMDCFKITGNTLTYPSTDYNSTAHSCWSFTPAYPGTVWFTLVRSPSSMAELYVMNADHSSYSYVYPMRGERVRVYNSNGGEMYISFSAGGWEQSSFEITWMVGETYAPPTLATRPPPTSAPPTPTPPIWTATPTHPPRTDTPPTPHPLDCTRLTGTSLRYPTRPTFITTTNEDVCWYIRPYYRGTVWVTLAQTPQAEGSYSYLSYHINVMNANHSETRSLYPSKGAKVSLPYSEGEDVYISFGGEGYVDTGFLITWVYLYDGDTLSPPTATPPTEAPTWSPWDRPTVSPETQHTQAGRTMSPYRWTQPPPPTPYWTWSPYPPSGGRSGNASSSSGDGSDRHTGVSPFLIAGSIVGGLLLVGGLVAAVVISQSQGSAADPAVGTGAGIPENVFGDTAGQDVVLNECAEEMGAWVAME